MNKKELLILSVGIFVTIIAWVSAELYQTNKATVVTNPAQAVVIPEYRMRSEVIQTIRSRTP